MLVNVPDQPVVDAVANQFPDPALRQAFSLARPTNNGPSLSSGTRDQAAHTPASARIGVASQHPFAERGGLIGAMRARQP